MGADPTAGTSRGHCFISLMRKLRPEYRHGRRSPGLSSSCSRCPPCPGESLPWKTGRQAGRSSFWEATRGYSEESKKKKKNGRLFNAACCHPAQSAHCTSKDTAIAEEGGFVRPRRWQSWGRNLGSPDNMPIAASTVQRRLGHRSLSQSSRLVVRLVPQGPSEHSGSPESPSDDATGRPPKNATAAGRIRRHRKTEHV